MPSGPGYHLSGGARPADFSVVSGPEGLSPIDAFHLTDGFRPAPADRLASAEGCGGDAAFRGAATTGLTIGLAPPIWLIVLCGPPIDCAAAGNADSMIPIRAAIAINVRIWITRQASIEAKDYALKLTLTLQREGSLNLKLTPALRGGPPAPPLSIPSLARLKRVR
jgi:hypothetical protein